LKRYLIDDAEGLEIRLNFSGTFAVGLLSESEKNSTDGVLQKELSCIFFIALMLGLM
jgi:hypothetical protein